MQNVKEVFKNHLPNENTKTRLTLRPYQKRIVKQCVDSFQEKTNDLVIVATAGGKSIMIAETAHRLNVPTLVLSPSREITQQNSEKMKMYVPEKEVGIYSASLSAKEVKKYTFATIQSVFKKPEKFTHFPLVCIDEAHLVTASDNLSSMFQAVLSHLPDSKVIGFTATPYRVERESTVSSDQKFITTKETIKIITGEEYFWHKILDSVPYQELLKKKFVCPIAQRTFSMPDKKVLRYQETQIALLRKVIDKYYSTLVFCNSQKEIDIILDNIRGVYAITSKTKKKDRELIIEAFKQGKVKMLLTHSALLAGFDAPNIDCIVMFRTFSSPAQYVQAVGRGTRLHFSKQHCFVLDCGYTSQNFGKFDEIELRSDQLIMKGKNWNGSEKTMKIPVRK